ncbi:MAG: ATP-grasp domain-containing protein [Pseudomonadales bacterium]|nr:ATP-grasp domain-containing protein [Pseudomonadales bacterium]MBO6563895.1 ATP-grasp domain-containing protein [Pseudomonadales bacterium]MBO6596376.1 ATP-grasp domain-containing protein [Pseudomonadales bacterium]MBO6822856.1 ATP-grasp domain-containing protein [Pseudomonadales bacterium]
MNQKTQMVFVINDPVVGLGLLRTAKLGHYKVNIVARTGCKWLRWTAACESFDEVDESRIANDLLSVLRERGFDHADYVCFAAGDIATQALQEIASEIKATCQHTMDSKARKKIGNKATFSEICKTVDVPTPQTWVINNKRLLPSVTNSEGFSFPVIVKAVNMSGSIGIREVNNVEELAAIVDDENYDYAPLVVQQFISGYDVGFSCIVENGHIRSGYTQRRSKGGDSFPRHDELLAHAETLCRAVKYSGPANIDARIDAAGNVYIIEWNARFWATSPLSYLLGIDLIAEGYQANESDSNVRHYHDSTYFSPANALKGLLETGPMGSDKARRYFRSILADLPAFIFTKVPASRKLFAF